MNITSHSPGYSQLCGGSQRVFPQCLRVGSRVQFLQGDKFKQMFLSFPLLLLLQGNSIHFDVMHCTTLRPIAGLVVAHNVHVMTPYRQNITRYWSLQCLFIRVTDSHGRSRKSLDKTSYEKKLQETHLFLEKLSCTHSPTDHLDSRLYLRGAGAFGRKTLQLLGKTLIYFWKI